jgi:hypothetical protein
MRQPYFYSNGLDIDLLHTLKRTLDILRMLGRLRAALDGPHRVNTSQRYGNDDTLLQAFE